MSPAFSPVIFRLLSVPLRAAATVQQAVFDDIRLISGGNTVGTTGILRKKTGRLRKEIFFRGWTRLFAKASAGRAQPSPAKQYPNAFPVLFAQFRVFRGSNAFVIRVHPRISAVYKNAAFRNRPVFLRELLIAGSGFCADGIV
ncbi:MAG: hypothetical protein RRC34_07105 [Lentisphaeria bacterium]|nr:hypothetical protein [Lentisphaeria bacterium]